MILRVALCIQYQHHSDIILLLRRVAALPEVGEEREGGRGERGEKRGERDRGREEEGQRHRGMEGEGVSEPLTHIFSVLTTLQ